jgi:protocatechuate 3,4-dioxygenase beta subunit
LTARLAHVLLLFVALDAQASGPSGVAATFPIAGTVVSSTTGQPIGRAKVTIISVEHNEFVKSVSSGANGHFAFSGLPAGKYSLVASAYGYRGQGFNQHGDFFTAIVVGPEYDAGNLTFRLLPDATIEGMVTDEDSEPVRNASVALFQRNNDSGQQRTQQVFNQMTDDRGHYQFSHLGPGTYFVAVSARPWYAQYPNSGESTTDPENARRAAEERTQLDVAYPMTFYPAAEDSSGASTIVVHPGERSTADIAVRAVPAVRLRLRFGETEDQKSSSSFGIAFPTVSERIFEGTLVPVMSSQGFGTKEGVYEYTGIAPGHYVIEMTGPGGKRRGGGWYKEMDLSGTVDLDTNESPTLAAITGALAFEGGARPAGKIYVVLMNRVSSENFTAEVSPKGAFDFGDAEIRPGTYDVALNNAPGFQLKNLLAKGARVSGKTLEISGGSVQVVCTATRAVARVDGTVQLGDKPFAGAMVVLVPLDPASNWTLFRRDQSDSDGTFTMHEVLPGPYTLIALENAWDLDWASPAALEPYLKNGTAIEVAGEGKLSVKVQLQ